MKNSNINESVSPIILAGGLGTRLGSVVGDMAKVLASVNGRPFLAYLLDQLIIAGFSNVILCTDYKADMVKEFFGENYKTLHIRYSQERDSLGTGGALRYALPMVKNEIVLVPGWWNTLRGCLSIRLSGIMRKRDCCSFSLSGGDT